LLPAGGSGERRGGELMKKKETRNEKRNYHARGCKREREREREREKERERSLGIDQTNRSNDPQSVYDFAYFSLLIAFF